MLAGKRMLFVSKVRVLLSSLMNAKTPSVMEGVFAVYNLNKLIKIEARGFLFSAYSSVLMEIQQLDRRSIVKQL